jgi:hypothetical protein
MKKIILFFMVALVIQAQRINQYDVISADGVNSSVTALDSAAVFTGKAEEIIYESAITVMIKSNVSGTGLAQYSKDGANWDLKIPFTYTSTDTVTKFIFGSYSRWFRIVYTNGATDQTSFRMQTIYHKQAVLPYKDNRVDTDVSHSVLPDGAADTTHQDLTIAAIDTANARLDALHTELIKKLSQATGDSIFVNVKEGNYLLQQLDDNTDLIEQKIDSVDSEISRTHLELIKKMSQTTGDSIKVGVDEVNYLLQVLRTTLATKVGQDTSEATLDRIHIESIKKFNQITGDSILVNTKEINYLLEVLRTTLATKEKQDSLKNDTQLIRSLISTLNGIVATSVGQDSSKNDTELIRGLLVELRTALQIIDDWDDGADKANVNATQSGTWDVGSVTTLPDINVNDISKGTQTNDIKITLDSEEVTVKNPIAVTDTVMTGSEIAYTQITSLTCKRVTIFNVGTTDLYISFNDASPTDAESLVIGEGFFYSYFDGEITNTNVLRLKGNYKVEVKN